MIYVVAIRYTLIKDSYIQNNLLNFHECNLSFNLG